MGGKHQLTRLPTAARPIRHPLPAATSCGSTPCRWAVALLCWPRACHSVAMLACNPNGWCCACKRHLLLSFTAHQVGLISPCPPLLFCTPSDPHRPAGLPLLFHHAAPAVCRAAVARRHDPGRRPGCGARCALYHNPCWVGCLVRSGLLICGSTSYMASRPSRAGLVAGRR